MPTRKGHWCGGRTQQLDGQRLIKQLDCCSKRGVAAGHARPSAVALLQRRRRRCAPRASAPRTGSAVAAPWAWRLRTYAKRGDQHHAKRLHRKARTLSNKSVVTLGTPQHVIRLPIHLAIDGLSAVQQHVPNSAQTLLQRFDNMGVFIGNALAIKMQAAARQPGDDRVTRAKAGGSHPTRQADQWRSMPQGSPPATCSS